MNKLFSKIAALSVGLAMAVGVGVAVNAGSSKVEEVKAAEGDVLYTFSSDSIVTGSGYTNYSDGDWELNIGGNNISAGWNKNASNARQVGSTFAIDSEVTATTYGWVASTKDVVDKAGKLEFSYTGGSGNSSGKLWLGYSTDGSSYSKVELKTGTQGSSCGTVNTTYTFEFDTIDSAYYAIIVTGGASGSAFRFDNVTAKLFEGQTVDPSLESMTIMESGNPADGSTIQWSSSAGIFHFTAEDENDVVSGVTWSTSDSEIATINSSTGYLTTVKPGSVTVYAEAEGYNKASASITISKGWKVESVTVSGSMSKTTYTTSESWSNNGLVATALYNTGWEEDVTSTADWSYNPASPAENVTSVVATATFEEESGSSSAQAVTVTVAHAGTAEDPFTVAEALTKCAEIGAVGNKGEGPWVTKGIISRVTSAPAETYWNATYYISDNGKQENELQVYRGFYLDNAKFDAETALLLTAGKVATVTGNLTGSYGSEYCQGNYLLALEDQETGDVDVTFAPESTSVEVGASGTFTASSETAGAVFTWSVDDSSVLTVDENSGEFEAVGLGVARVTVTASAGGKEGSTYADITVNGADVMSVAEADAIAATLTPGSGADSTTSYYIYVGGYVKEFATTKDSSDNITGFDIFDLNEQKSVVVYTGKANYSTFIDGLALGDYIVIKAKVQNYNGKYELTNPEKVSSAKSCLSFVFEFKSYTEGTEGICTDYDGKTSNKAAFEAIWETLKTSYDGLNETEQGRLASMTGCGDTLINAMGLYDYVTGKYELNNFITGRTPVAFTNRVAFGNADLSNDNLMIIVIVISSITVLSLGVLIALKKKKHN